MKILKIEDGKGYFAVDGEKWQFIDEIDKDNLMLLINKVLKDDVSIDEFKSELFGNQAHHIIYKSIYDKISSLSDDKNKFKDESERLYLEALKKYTNEA